MLLPTEIWVHIMSFLDFWALKYCMHGICKGIIPWELWKKTFGESMSLYMDCKISPFLVDLAGINTLSNLFAFEKRVKSISQWDDLATRRQLILEVFSNIINDDYIAFQKCIFNCPHVLNNFHSCIPYEYNKRDDDDYFYYVFALKRTYGFDFDRPFHEMWNQVGIYLPPTGHLISEMWNHLSSSFVTTIKPWGEQIDMRDLVMIATYHKGSWIAPQKIKALAPDEFWKAERVALRVARNTRRS